MVRNASLSPKIFLGSYLLALLGYALWMGDRLPFHNDILVYVYPERVFNLKCLQSGLIPLWNPYLSCGVPHLANWQSAFFYPPYWLLNILGLPQGLFWMALFHEAWAFAGFYFWAKSQKCPDWAAALCAFSFAGSAHFTRCWVNLPFIATASWIPWVFLAFHRALDQRGIRQGFWAVAVLSLQWLAGYPTFAFYTGVALSLWVVFERRSWPEFGRLVLLMAFALVLTAFQWLPFLEFITYAAHDHWKAFPYYTHPWEYLTLLDPTILGVPDASGYRSEPTNTLFGNLYFGFIPCLLWLASLTTKRGRQGFWGGLSLLLLVWMAGPALVPSRGLPERVFTFLEPSKAVGLFLFTACTAWGRFVGKALDSPRTGWKTAGAWAAAIFCLLDLGVLPLRLIYRVPDPYSNTALGEQVQEIRNAAAGERVLALQVPSGLSVKAPQVNEAQESKLSRAFVDNLLPNTNVVWGLRAPTAYFSLQTKTLTDLMHYLNRGFPYGGDLLDVAGVRAFLLPQPLPRPKYRLAGRIGGNFLSLDPRASADMRWVGQKVELPDRVSVLDVLSEPGSQWQRKVYLEKESPGSPCHLPAAAHSLAETPAEGYSRPRPGWALEGVRAPQAGYLVFNDSYAPGWHAWVDGDPKPLLRAYGLFMAVAVDKGAHTVDFRYEPASFRLGLFISLIGLIVIAAGVGKADWNSVPLSGRKTKRK